MGHDPDVYWDGGYEDMVDSGDGIEHLYIGPEQAYDIETGHIPAKGFETRPELPGRRPADGVELPSTFSARQVSLSKQLGGQNPATKGHPYRGSRIVTSKKPKPASSGQSQTHFDEYAVERAASALGLSTGEASSVIFSLGPVQRSATHKSITDFSSDELILAAFGVAKCRNYEQSLKRAREAIRDLHRKIQELKADGHGLNSQERRKVRTRWIQVLAASACELNSTELFTIAATEGKDRDKSKALGLSPHRIRRFRETMTALFSVWNSADQQQNGGSTPNSTQRSRRKQSSGKRQSTIERQQAARQSSSKTPEQQKGGNVSKTEHRSARRSMPSSTRSGTPLRGGRVNWIDSTTTRTKGKSRTQDTREKRKPTEIMKLRDVELGQTSTPAEICNACEQPIRFGSMCGCS